MALGGAFDLVGFDFAGDINISNALKTTNGVIKEYAQREAKEWAEKQIARQNKKFNDLLFCKVTGEFINGFVGIGADGALQMIDSSLDKKLTWPDFLDNGYVIFARK